MQTNSYSHFYNFNSFVDGSQIFFKFLYFFLKDFNLE